MTKKTLLTAIENYLTNGGKIKKLKSQELPKIKPILAQSAVPHIQKGRYNVEVVVKEPKEKTIKPRLNNPEGVTLQSILEEFNVKGTVARKALRSSEFKKPGKQWVWDRTDKKEIKAIRKFIKHLA